MNSFREEQVIDFSGLCENGIFGIFGSTGSGKSTILDGITLALYGKVERAKGGTQGIINQNEEKAYVSFTFSLGERKFKAERTYKRGPDGGVNHQQCRLVETIDGEEIVIAEKKREMDEQVEEILGLNVTDFTRAVVLPQGKFAEFLTLQGTERRKMLQRLFGLEKYGEQLTQRVRSKLTRVANELEKLVGRQSELGDASEKTLKDAQRVLKEQEEVLKQLMEKDKFIKEKNAEYQEIIRLQDELNELETKKATLELEKPQMLLQEEKYQWALKANNVKPFLDRVDYEKALLTKVQQQLGEQLEQLNIKKTSYQEVEKKQLYWQEQINTQGKELERLLLKLDEAIIHEEARDKGNIELQSLRQQYKNKEIAHLELKAQMEQLEETRKTLQTRKDQLTQVLKINEGQLSQKENITKIREAYQALQQAHSAFLELDNDLAKSTALIKLIAEDKRIKETELEKLDALIISKEEELAKLPQEHLSQQEIQVRKDDLNNLDKLISSLEFNYQELHNKQQNISQNNNKIINLKASLNQFNGLSFSLKLNRERLEREIDKLEEDYRKNERANLAYFIRQSLIDNEPCPVCGSLDHPHPISRAVEKEGLETLQQELNEKKGQIQKLLGDIENILSQQTILQTQIDSFENNNRQLRKEEELISQRITELRNQVKEDWSQIDLKDLKDLHEKETILLNNIQKNLQQLTEVKQELTKELTELKIQFNGAKEKIAAIKAKEETLSEGEKVLKAKLLKVSAERENKKQNFLNIAQDIPEEKVEEIYNNLVALSKETEKLRLEEQKISTSLDEVYQQLLYRHGELQSTQQELDTLKISGTNLNREVQQLSAKINEITDGKKALQVKEETNLQVAQLSKGLTKVTKDLELAKDLYETQNNIYLTTQAREREIEKRLGEGREELVKRTMEQGFTSQGQLEDALCTKEEIENLKKEIDQYSEKNMLITQNIQRVTEILMGRKLEPEKWQQFLEEKERAEEQLAKEQKLIHQLQDRLETLEKNHLRWKELEDERKKQTDLSEKLNQLDKLFRGNTFVEFIAEEQLLNVAIDASQRLGELTGYKYGLEVDSEGGFIIRDDGNGGLRRPVASLSGGETFLTSLALALALSSQIQLRGQYPLEFFFLDEGFGTLDSHLLETVINSLERLHSQNMTIGVISHVPELKARMARRLIVTGAEIGGKGSQLEVEYP